MKIKYMHLTNFANYFKTVTKLQIPNTICPLYDTTASVILFQNIQSLSAHKDDFFNNAQMQKVQIIGLTEISTSPGMHVPQFPDFVSFSNTRYRGGVCFFVRKSLDASHIALPETETDISFH